MKETIYAIVYERFYKKLRHKFYKEFIPSDSGIPEDSKEVWNRPYDNLSTNIAKDLFGINNEFYFHRKYDEEAKQHLEYGYPLYPITVGRKQFSLALKYLLFGRAERIDDFPELDFDLKAKWETNYTTLLGVFIKREFPNGIEEKISKVTPEINTLSDDDLENILLGMVANQSNALYSKTIENLIFSFFNNLSSKKYFDAWLQIWPFFQSMSIWNGNLDRFQNSFSDVEVISHVNIISYEYSPFEITCFVNYLEEGYIIDFPHIRDVLITKYKEGNLSDYEMKIINDYFSENCRTSDNYFDWLTPRPNDRIDFFGLDDDKLLDNNFQKTLAGYFLYSNPLRSIIDNTKKIRYGSRNFAYLTFIYDYNNWLIKEIRTLEIKGSMTIKKKE